MDESEDLDISWIDEQEKLHSVDKNYFREPMEQLSVTIIYININSYIENIVCEKQPLTQTKKYAILEKERLIQIIQSKKKTTPHSKYKFIDALLYNIELEPENIQNYSNTNPSEENTNIFLKRLPIIDDINIPPSIFIFHNVNGLYLLFKEEARTDIQNIRTQSILKSDNQTQHKITKKVKIVLKRPNQSTTKKQVKNDI
jgi:hypothetical protein